MWPGLCRNYEGNARCRLFWNGHHRSSPHTRNPPVDGNSVFRNCTAAISACLVIAGCATAANYEKQLDAWIGKSELELVRSWGAPAAVYEVGPSRFLTYTKHMGTSLAGTPAPVIATQLTCTTHFEVSKAIVSSWKTEGNACRSR